MATITLLDIKTAIAYGYGNGKFVRDFTTDGKMGIYRIQPVEVARAILPLGTKDTKHGIAAYYEIKEDVLEALYKLAYDDVETKSDYSNSTNGTPESMIIKGYWGSNYFDFISEYENEDGTESGIETLVNLFKDNDVLNELIAGIKISDAMNCCNKDAVLTLFYYLVGDLNGKQIIDKITDIDKLTYSEIIEIMDAQLIIMGFNFDIKTFMDNAFSFLGGINGLENYGRVYVE